MSNEPQRQKFYIFHKGNAEGVLNLALGKAHSVFVDKLDCREDLHRQPCKKQPEEIIQMALESKTHVHWTFILREKCCEIHDAYWDIGCIVMDPNDREISYFLWIEVSPRKGENIAKKFKLEARL